MKTEINIFDPNLNALLKPLIDSIGIDTTHLPNVFIVPKHKRKYETLYNTKADEWNNLTSLPGLFDVLGTYEHEGDKITIYKESIEDCAEKLSKSGKLQISAEELFKLVVLHEYAHWYSVWIHDHHWNKETFEDKKNTAYTEFLAQTIVYCRLNKSAKTKQLRTLFVDFSNLLPNMYYRYTTKGKLGWVFPKEIIERPADGDFKQYYIDPNDKAIQMIV